MAWKLTKAQQNGRQLGTNTTFNLIELPYRLKNIIYAELQLW